MKTPRDVLVIDDESVVLKGVQRVCASEGLSVETASAARDGLRQMDVFDFRLVLCDIMMEGMDGFQFLAEAQRLGHRMPIVMTTGYSTLENAVRSLQSGATDYLTKPYTADELAAVLRRILPRDPACGPDCVAVSSAGAGPGTTSTGGEPSWS